MFKKQVLILCIAGILPFSTYAVNKDLNNISRSDNSIVGMKYAAKWPKGKTKQKVYRNYPKNMSKPENRSKTNHGESRYWEL